MKRDVMRTLLTTLALACMPTLIQAQEIGGYEAYYPYSYSEYDDRFTDSMHGYSTPDYYYNTPYYGQINRGYRDPESAMHFGRHFDYSSDDYFSSGISSYQGTSTGPGPNGGYPGSPRGIYPTHYVDTSIYLNSYMRVQSR